MKTFEANRLSGGLFNIRFYFNILKDFRVFKWIQLMHHVCRSTAGDMIAAAPVHAFGESGDEGRVVPPWFPFM